MYDMMHLAIQTDSTRFITLYDTGMNAVPAIKGVDTDYHMLSHHGRNSKKIDQLTFVETEVMKVFGRFLKKLAESKEASASLLDNTMVLFGSNLGNANSNDTKEHADHFGWRRLPARPAPLVRLQKQLPVAETLCLDVTAAGTGDGYVRDWSWIHARIGNALTLRLS
jgi:hypothetical protein